MKSFLHHKINLLFFLMVIAGNHVIAQSDIKDSRWYDSATYQAYLKGNWPEVLSLGTEAIHAGFDYYYLRMRLGAANYESGYYRRAIFQYDKALRFNSSDEDAKSGKYFSYLNLGDRDHAAQLAGKMSREKSDTLHIRQGSFLDMLYLESGYSPTSEHGHNAGELCGKDSIYGEEDCQKDLFYTHIGAKLRIMPALSIFAAYSRMNINMEKRLAYSSLIAERDSVAYLTYGQAYFYSFPRKFSTTTVPYKITQGDFYMNASFQAENGLKLTAAVHHLQVRYKKTNVQFSGSLSDTAYYLASDSSWHTFSYQGASYSLYQWDTSYSNYVFSLSGSKDLGDFTLDLSGSISDFERKRQAQLGSSLTWYPFGNNNLYGSAGAVSVFNQKKQRMVYEFMLGGKVLDNTWVTGFWTIGNLHLYNEKNAYIVYNQQDNITSRTGLDLTYLLGKHAEIRLMYRIYQKEFRQLKYVNTAAEGSDPLISASLSSQTYTNQIFIGGLTWKF